MHARGIILLLLLLLYALKRFGNGRGIEICRWWIRAADCADFAAASYVANVCPNIAAM